MKEMTALEMAQEIDRYCDERTPDCDYSEYAPALARAFLRQNEALTQAEKAIRSIPFLSQDPGVKKCYEWVCNYGSDVPTVYETREHTASDSYSEKEPSL